MALTAALGLKAIAMASGNHPDIAEQIEKTISVCLRERALGPVLRALTAFVVHRAQHSSFDDAARVAGFVERRQIGRTMTRDDVVTYALDQLAATT